MIPPPLETAANTVLGVVVGSTATSMTRPPTFVGPTNCQRVLPASGSDAAWAEARLTCASVTGPPTDDARSSIDCGLSDSFIAPLHGTGPVSRAGAFLGVTDVMVATTATTSTPLTSSTKRLINSAPYRSV